MTRYRKKPVEVEAWQVGSEEPKPEWLPDDCIGVSRHVGLLMGYWYVLESPYIYPKLVDNFRFRQTYEVVE